MNDKIAIIVGTNAERYRWASDCLRSIQCSIPTIVVSTGGYELGKIKWVYDNTDLERFAFLQDSVIVKDNDLITMALESSKSVCLFHDGNFCMNGYNGIYERKVLDKLTIPIINNKTESIIYEGEFAKLYQELTQVQHLFDPNPTSSELVIKYGRENMVFENPVIQKWKANWGQIPHHQWDSHDENYQEYLKIND